MKSHGIKWNFRMYKSLAIPSNVLHIQYILVGIRSTYTIKMVPSNFSVSDLPFWISPTYVHMHARKHLWNNNCSSLISMKFTWMAYTHIFPQFLAARQELEPTRKIVNVLFKYIVDCVMFYVQVVRIPLLRYPTIYSLQ